MSIFDKISERVGDIVDEVFLPDALRGVHKQAQDFILKESYDKALAILRPSLTRFPEVSKTYFLIALSELHLENYPRSIDAFDKSNQLRESPESLFYCGIAYEKLGKGRVSQRYLTRASTFGELPFAFDLEYALGRTSRTLGQFEKAIRHFRRARKIDSHSTDLSASLAEALCEIGEFEKAEEILDAISNSPALTTSVIANIAKGKILEAKGSFALSQESWKSALEHAKGIQHEEAILGLSRTHNALEEYDSSLLLIHPVQMSPIFRYERQVILGQSYLALGNPKKAALSFEKALELKPAGNDALLGRGEVAIASGEDATIYFERVLETSDPEVKHRAYFGLGLSKRDAFDVLSARHMFEEALEFEGPYTARIWGILGEISLEYGDAAEGLWWFNKAEEIGYDIREKKAEAVKRLSFSWELPDSLETIDEIRSALKQLGAFLSADSRLGGFMSAYQTILETLNQPLSVALLGEFNAGKSSVVNALIGEKVVPVGVVPTTAQSGVIRFASRKTAQIIYNDGRIEESNFVEAKKTMKSNSDDIRRVEFLYPHPQLRMVNFWDTPGFNALEARHEEVAKKALNTAEAIIWVMDANQVLSQTQRDQIDSVKDSAERLIIVINKIDRVSDEAVETLVTYVQDNIGEKILAVFPLSAKLAEQEPTKEASRFAAFSDFFDQNVVQYAGKIKAIDVRKKIVNFALTLSAFQKGMLNRVGEAQTHLSHFRDALDKESVKLPRRVIREEITTLQDWSIISLQGIEGEVSESLTAVGHWSGKLAFKDDDIDYILQRIRTRLDEILDRSYQRLSLSIAEVEADISEQLEPLIRGLPLQNARATQRSIQSFFDEARRLRTQLDARIFGAIRAETRGKIDAAGETALRAIEYAQNDRSKWRAPLKALLPSFDEVFGEALQTWLMEFFSAAYVLGDRVEAELEILELEARYRFDARDLSLLVNVDIDGN